MLKGKSLFSFAVKKEFKKSNFFNDKKFFSFRSYGKTVEKKQEENENLERDESDKSFRVYAFGLSEHGALGLQKPDRQKRFKRYIPNPMRHFFAEENSVTKVAAGYGFSVFSVKNKGPFKIYGCGIGTDSQIGKQKYSITTSPQPIDIGLESPKTKIISLDAGRAHVGIVTDEEGVFMLGNNSYGQCGIPPNKSTDGNSSITNHFTDLNGESIKEVVCGQDHTLFLTENGRVYSCGWSCDGQTGQNVTSNITKPKLIEGDLSKNNIVKLSSNSDTVLALTDDGKVFGWGNSEHFQLCNNPEVQQVNKPMKLAFLNPSGKIADIAAGGSFCAVINTEGEVYTWGYGILGAGPCVAKSGDPILIPKTLFGQNEFQPDVKPKSVFAGLSHFAVINNCNDLYTWGKNRHGCLGVGHVRDQYFPYKVSMCALACTVSCGLDHTMVLAKPLS